MQSKSKFENYAVASELGANYQRAWRRYTALKERGEFTGPGRPPYFSKKDQTKFEHKIMDDYKDSQSLSFSRLQTFCEELYDKKYSQLTPHQQENRPFQIPMNHCYPLSKRFDLKSIKPTTTEKDRNEYATRQTIIDFFEYTFTLEMAEGVPDDLTFNADECSADVGIPTKVLVPPGAKRGPYENKFADNLHITAMVALNAAGDAIPPYLILPLKYLPRNVAPMVARNQLNVGGSENGYMTDENFANWAIWFIEFVNDLKKQRKYSSNQRSLLFLDGHVTRNNKELMKKFRDAKIDVIIFPPHLTHLMQPFDTTVARPLKQALKRLANEILSVCSPEQQTITSFLRLAQVIGIIDAVRASTLITNCKIAFKCCGLFPRDQNEVLVKSGIKNSHKSYIDFSESATKPIKISGRCITQDDVLDNLREVQKKRKKKIIKNKQIIFFLPIFYVYFLRVS